MKQRTVLFDQLGGGDLRAVFVWLFSGLVRNKTEHIRFHHFRVPVGVFVGSRLLYLEPLNTLLDDVFFG